MESKFGFLAKLEFLQSWASRLIAGVKKAFDEFKERNQIQLRRVFTYGMGGAVFIISESI